RAQRRRQLRKAARARADPARRGERARAHRATPNAPSPAPLAPGGARVLSRGSGRAPVHRLRRPRAPRRPALAVPAIRAKPRRTGHRPAARQRRRRGLLVPPRAVHGAARGLEPRGSARARPRRGRPHGPAARDDLPRRPRREPVPRGVRAARGRAAAALRRRREADRSLRDLLRAARRIRSRGAAARVGAVRTPRAQRRGMPPRRGARARAAGEGNGRRARALACARVSGLSSPWRAAHRASPVLGWLVRVSTERPRAVIGAWLALAALACAGTAALEFDPTTESILSQEGPAWQFYRESLASYGGDEVL